MAVSKINTEPVLGERREYEKQTENTVKRGREGGREQERERERVRDFRLHLGARPQECGTACQRQDLLVFLNSRGY